MDCLLQLNSNSQHNIPIGLNYIPNVNIENICSFLDNEQLHYFGLTCTFMKNLIINSEFLARSSILPKIQNAYAKYIKILYSRCYHNDVELLDRMYLDHTKFNHYGDVLPLFDANVYHRMTMFLNSRLAQIYCRLIPYNWTLHLSVDRCNQDKTLPLRSIYSNVSIMKKRRLNVYEKKLFKYFKPSDNIRPTLSGDKFIKNLSIMTAEQLEWYEQLYFTCQKSDECKSNINNFNDESPVQSVNSFDVFIHNLENNIYYNYWKNIIFKNNNKHSGYFCISGGSLIKCLVHNYKELATSCYNSQDVDFFACKMAYNNFMENVSNIKKKFLSSGFKIINNSRQRYYNDSITVKSVYVNFDKNFTTRTIHDTINTTEYYIGYFENNYWLTVDHLSDPTMWKLTRRNLYTVLKMNGILHYQHPIMKNLVGPGCQSNRTFKAVITYINTYVKLKQQIKKKFNEKILNIEHKQWTEFQFIYYNENTEESKILYGFDLDCCQAAFDGEKVLATYAFIQSINTNTMICYSMNDNIWLRHNYLLRIQKYIKRGHKLIINKKCILDKEQTGATIIKDRYVALKWFKLRKDALKEATNLNTFKDSNNNDWFGIKKDFIEYLQQLYMD